MTEIELAKALRKSNYTCEGVNCEECKKTNYIKQCLMGDVQIYCDDILGADDNYIEKLEKENAELKAHCKAVDEVNEKLKEQLKNEIEFNSESSLGKENERLKKENQQLKNNWSNIKEKLRVVKDLLNIENVWNIHRENEKLKIENDYQKAVIQDLLDGGEMARQNAIDILRGEK